MGLPPDHYRALGLNTSATAQEVRRAYRILARRYHPDLNPGNASEDKFKKIAAAYAVLSDGEARKQYDAERASSGLDSETVERIRKLRANKIRESAQERFEKARQQQFGEPPPEPHRAAQPKNELKPPPEGKRESFGDALKAWSKKIFAPVRESTEDASRSGTTETRRLQKISVIEVSVTVQDAIMGIKRTVEIDEPTGARKISVSIPPGVRTGTVIRMKARNNPGEELVMIVRVAAHPYLSIHTRGLVCELPIALHEAINGAQLSAPTLEDPVIIRIPPGVQSGSEIRVKERGISNRDGTIGDLFYRLMIRIPEAFEAVGLKDHAATLEQYYGRPVREGFPTRLLG